MSANLPVFTLIHVVLSLIGIISGLVVVGGFLAGARFGGWINLFLATTVLTSATGFGFPFVTLLPSHIVGALSLLVLAVAGAAWYWNRPAGARQSVFTTLSVFALYLNVFVLVAQLFQKIPALAVLGPGPTAPAFAITNLLVLIPFVWLGRAALRRGKG